MTLARRLETDGFAIVERALGRAMLGRLLAALGASRVTPWAPRARRALEKLEL